jgi:hypothetical protein
MLGLFRTKAASPELSERAKGAKKAAPDACFVIQSVSEESLVILRPLH